MGGYHFDGLHDNMWAIFKKHVHGDWNLKKAALDLITLFDEYEFEFTETPSFVEEYLSYDDKKDVWVVRGIKITRVIIEDLKPTTSTTSFLLEGNTAFVIKNVFSETNNFGFLIGRVAFIDDIKYDIIGVGTFEPGVKIPVGDSITIICKPSIYPVEKDTGISDV